MAAVKVVQKISSITGSNSATIALKSGYIRVTPVADSFIEVGTGAEATSDSSLFVPADTSVVFKERVSSSDIVGITTGEASTTFTFSTGMESPFAVGDTIEVTGATGFNTTSATVTQNIPPNPTGSHGFDASQSGKVVIGVASSDKTTSATATASLRRVVLVDVATSGSTKTHVSEVQIVGDF